VSRNRQLILIGIPAFLMLVAALPFAFSDLDRDLMESFYDPGTASWPLEPSQPWYVLNNWGERPGALVGVGAIIVLTISIGRPALARARRIALYLTAVVLAGPGVIVNVILKSHWGRPRPHETEGLGGHEAFERLLQYDPSSSGKSFPSGHASMGFYFFAVGFALLALGHRRLGLGTIVFGGIAGFTIGWARLVGGDHFPSDVIACGLLMWLISAGFFFLFRLHRPAPAAPFGPLLPASGHLKSAYSLSAAVFLIVFGSLLWPNLQSSFRPLSPLPDERFALHLDLEGSVEIRHGDTPGILTRITGFGFPKSSVQLVPSRDAGTLVLRHHRDGVFTGMMARSTLILPPGQPCLISVGERVSHVGFHPSTQVAPPGLIDLRITSRAPARPGALHTAAIAPLSP